MIRFDDFTNIRIFHLQLNNNYSMSYTNDSDYTANHVCISECPASLYANGGFNWETGAGTCTVTTADGQNATVDEILYFGIPIN